MKLGGIFKEVFKGVNKSERVISVTVIVFGQVLIFIMHDNDFNADAGELIDGNQNKIVLWKKLESKCFSDLLMKFFF